jgi:hypothetical protein
LKILKLKIINEAEVERSPNWKAISKANRAIQSRSKSAWNKGD